jgi:hypothetical protein
MDNIIKNNIFIFQHNLISEIVTYLNSEVIIYSDNTTFVSNNINDKILFVYEFFEINNEKYILRFYLCNNKWSLIYNNEPIINMVNFDKLFEIYSEIINGPTEYNYVLVDDFILTNKIKSLNNPIIAKPISKSKIKSITYNDSDNNDEDELCNMFNNKLKINKSVINKSVIKNYLKK